MMSGKFLLESLVGTNHRGHGSCRLSFVGNQRILVHGFHDFRVAREPFVRKVQDVGMRRKVAQPFENREGEIGRGQLECEAFADQIQPVRAGDQACRGTRQPRLRCDRGGRTASSILAILPP